MGADLNPEITAVTTLLARSRTLWEHTELRRPPGPSGCVCVWGGEGGEGRVPCAVSTPVGDTEPWASVSQAL